MKTPEQRASKWLRVYPRLYRKRRGEELVATLLDKARDNPKLPAREIASLLAHGSWMRARRFRLVAAAVVVAVVGAGLGAFIGFWGEPTGYATTVVPRSMIVRHARLSPTQVATLRSLAVQFAAFQQSPNGIELIDRSIADVPVHLVCSDSVVNFAGNRGIEMRCVSPDANAARTVASNLAHAFGVMYGNGKASGVPIPGAPSSTEAGPLVATHGVTARPVVLGAITGFLFVIVIGLGTKRRRLVRQVASG